MEYVFIWLVFGVISGMVMNSKGRSGVAGFALGVLLGPIGLVAALVMRPDQDALEAAELQRGSSRKCPYCAEIVKMEALVCKHCGRELPRRDL